MFKNPLKNLFNKGPKRNHWQYEITPNPDPGFKPFDVPLGIITQTIHTPAMALAYKILNWADAEGHTGQSRILTIGDNLKGATIVTCTPEFLEVIKKAFANDIVSVEKTKHMRPTRPGDIKLY